MKSDKTVWWLSVLYNSRSGAFATRTQHPFYVNIMRDFCLTKPIILRYITLSRLCSKSTIDQIILLLMNYYLTLDWRLVYSMWLMPYVNLYCSSAQYSRTQLLEMYNNSMNSIKTRNQMKRTRCKLDISNPMCG